MWKVSDLYPNYEVSDQGEVRNAKTKKLLSLKKKIRGYVYVHLHQDGKSKVVTVHRLIASAFIPNPNNLETVNHINYIKDDNRVENLEWVENKEHVLMHNGKKVIIDGIEYKSLRKAEKSLGINRARITTAMEKYKTNILNSSMIRR